jgi:hypothetical protein
VVHRAAVFNALLAALVAMLPDQVPVAQRGTVDLVSRTPGPGAEFGQPPSSAFRVMQVK